MTDREHVLAAYERAWATRDEPAIRAALDRCWKTSSTYVSPLTDVLHGIEALTNLILDFPVMFPGAQIRATSAPDIHHNVAYFTWQLSSTTRIRTLGRDYGMTLNGVDFVEFDDGGWIKKITAFFGFDHHVATVPNRRRSNGARRLPERNGSERNGAAVIDLDRTPPRQPQPR